MGNISWYWRFVRLHPSGGCIAREIPEAKAFFSQQFPALDALVSAPSAKEERFDQAVQRHLIALLQESLDSDHHYLAEICLRCYISNQIPFVCTDLARQFGKHGITRNELLACVMDDVNPNRPLLWKRNNSSSRSLLFLWFNWYQVFHKTCSASIEKLSLWRTSLGWYLIYEYEKISRPLAATILQTFNPDRSQLSGWTRKLVRQHKVIRKDYLQPLGIYPVSDWSILNETECDDLPKILLHSHNLSAEATERACSLLKSFHEVYRVDRRTRKAKGACKPPTEEQLSRIKQTAKLSQPISTVKQSLESLANLLRPYYVSRKSGMVPTESMDLPEVQQKAERFQVEKIDADELEEERKFLNSRRREIEICLDQAIEQEIRDRLTQLQPKNSNKSHKVNKANAYIRAFKLYYCEAVRMVDIAQILELKGQYEVTRLLQPKAFRVKIRHQTLQCLIQRNSDAFTQTPQEADALKKSDIALEEYLDTVTLSAEQCLFIQRLCQIIQRFN